MGFSQVCNADDWFAGYFIYRRHSYGILHPNLTFSIFDIISRNDYFISKEVKENMSNRISIILWMATSVRDSWYCFFVITSSNSYNIHGFICSFLEVAYKSV
jgi:hypothetical protein